VAEPVEAVTVRVEPDPDTAEIVGVPVIPPPCTSEKFAAETPVTDSLNVTVHETALPFVSAAETRAIDEVVGACVSNAYVCPTTGTEPPSAFPAASWIEPLLARFSPIVAAFPPVVPVADIVTVHVAVGADPEGVAAVTDGAVPPVPDVAAAKFAAVTFVTGSLKITAQCSEAAFVGVASARFIDETAGSAVSTLQVYDAEDDALPPDTACTWNVCDPLPRLL
jgi:hypothetical protein